MIRLFIVLIVLFVCTFNQKLTLDLKTTEAILYTNDLVVLKFKCEGGVGEKKFEFTGIPSNWRINKNDLVIYNYTVGDKQEWSF